MDIQLIATVIFIVLMCAYLIKVRKDLDMQKIIFPFLYIILYRSKWGLRFMKEFPRKRPGLVKWFGHIGVVIGFIGMVLISAQILYHFVEFFITPDAPPAVAPVLPVDGVPGAVYVPFFYWIISIFIIATVHEFAHGVVSNHYKIPVRNSGFAFMGIILPVIPAAFVEPDEKILPKKSAWKQLSVFAAGPFSNIVLAFLCLGVMIAVINPIASAAFVNDGVSIQSTFEGSAAKQNEMAVGDVITGVDDYDVFTVEDFTIALEDRQAGEEITLHTKEGSFQIELGEHPSDSERGYLGVSVEGQTSVDEGFENRFGGFSVSLITWTSELFFWLVLLNLGIGLFNLLPLGIVDGGRMLYVGLDALVKKKENKARVEKIWKYVSLSFLFIILFMIISAFL